MFKFFKRRKLNRLGNELVERLAWLERLKGMRLGMLSDAVQLGELSEFDQRQILTVNFELASHASRALSILREIEEAGDTKNVLDAEFELGRMRKILRRFADLPAIPRRDIDTVSQAQVTKLWARFTKDRESFDMEERRFLLELDAASLLKDDAFLSRGEGLTPEERRAEHEQWAEIYRDLDWDEVFRGKTDTESGQEE